MLIYYRKQVAVKVAKLAWKMSRHRQSDGKHALICSGLWPSRRRSRPDGSNCHPPHFLSRQSCLPPAAAWQAAAVVLRVRLAQSLAPSRWCCSTVGHCILPDGRLGGDTLLAGRIRYTRQASRGPVVAGRQDKQETSQVPRPAPLVQDCVVVVVAAVAGAGGKGCVCHCLIAWLQYCSTIKAIFFSEITSSPP